MTALRDFVADLMEREGAAVETLEPDGLAVIAPPEVRSAFGWPELARLGFGVELPVGAQRVGIEGEWLERFGALLAGHGRYAERHGPPEVSSDAFPRTPAGFTTPAFDDHGLRSRTPARPAG